METKLYISSIGTTILEPGDPLTKVKLHTPTLEEIRAMCAEAGWTEQATEDLISFFARGNNEKQNR